MRPCTNKNRCRSTQTLQSIGFIGWWYWQVSLPINGLLLWAFSTPLYLVLYVGFSKNNYFHAQHFNIPNIVSIRDFFSFRSCILFLIHCTPVPERELFFSEYSCVLMLSTDSPENTMLIDWSPFFFYVTFIVLTIPFRLNDYTNEVHHKFQSRI